MWHRLPLLAAVLVLGSPPALAGTTVSATLMRSGAGLSSRLSPESMLEWKTTILRYGARSAPVKGTYLYYAKGSNVQLSTDCVGALVEFNEPAKHYRGELKQHVTLTLTASVQVPQRCSIVARKASSPSQSATLNVIITKKFNG